jgi:AcrR family transcriptional regulator
MQSRSDRQLEIASIAAQLFRQKGYAAVTMRDLASAMNIKAASLYNHISSKQDVLALVVVDLAAAFTRGISEINALDLSVADKLSRVIKLHIDLTVAYPHAMSSLNNDWMHLDSVQLKIFIEQRDYYEETLRSIIRIGIAEKTLFKVDEDVVVFSMLSTLRTLYLWYGKRSQMSQEELYNELRQALLIGLVMTN